MEAEEKRRNPYYMWFNRRMAMVVIMVAITPMILVSGIMLHRFSVYSHEMVHAHLEEMVLKHKHNIDFFLHEKLSNIRHLSRIFEIEDFKDERFLRERLRALQEEYSSVFVDLGLIDETGRQVAYAGPFGLEKAYYGDAAWFKEAIQVDHYISDVFLGLRAQPHFIVATRQPVGDSRYILRATIDFLAFNLLVENLRLGDTGVAFILNREGEFQTRPPRETKLTQQQYLNLFDKGRLAGIIDKDKGGLFSDVQKWYTPDDEERNSILTVEKISQSNKKILIVAAFLKNNDWLLIFQQDANDAFARLNRTRKIAALIFVIGALSIIAVTLLVSRKLSKRIARVKSEKDMVEQQIIETGKLASIGELAAGIAHEINNPVAIMVEEAGWIQDLLAEGINKEGNLEEFERALKQIENQGRRCKEITHKLLSFARKTDSRVQAVQLNDLITEVVDLSSQKSRYANVDVHTRLDPYLPDTLASITEMQQVLLNLINNALDAMEKKGGRLDIATESRGNEIVITVEDTGPGIPASNLARLFDPFFTTKPVGKGTGLGLSICYGIINKMGGKIEVESTVGVGTTFRIILPITNSSE
ncbi:MAG: sensor histidine kinase [Desulfobacteraceae bacterium]|nr:MAG: sensor histidine kinase [Desulfobacteraceae bacterium]